jgi:hypothetical protein
MTLVTPATILPGDDLTASRLQTMTDGVLQMQGNTPVGSGSRLDYFSGYTAGTAANPLPILPHNVATAVDIDTEEDDYANGHSTVTNLSRYMGQNAGRYLVSVVGLFASNATGQRVVHITKNGVSLPAVGLQLAVNANSGGNTAIHVAGELRLNGTTDYIQTWATQTSGISLTLALRMSVAYIGA